MSVYVPRPCDETLSEAECPSCQGARRNEKWVLAVTVLGSSMAFIDGTVVNVALPALQQHLSATMAQLQWVVEAYVLFLAALLVVGGVLGDRFGHRRIFLLGVGLFALASAWCGMAPTVDFLIWGRAVQGLGGALLIPSSLSVLSASFPEEKRGAAIGLWSAFTAINAAVGPVLGGWLVDNASWRWIFYINIPLAVAVATILWFKIAETKLVASKAPFDIRGALLITLGLGAIIFGLIESARYGLGHPLIVVMLIGGVALLAGFLYAEARHPAPMLPLRLFRSGRFSGINALTFLLYAALSGGLFFVPFHMVQIQGYSATAAGGAFMPFIVIMAVLSRWSGGLLDRYGARLPLILGPVIAGAGFALFALPAHGESYWVSTFPGMVVLGLGMAISVPPLTAAVMSSVETGQTGIASGVNNAVSRIGGLLAVAALGLLALTIFNNTLDAALLDMNAPMAVSQALESERINMAGAALPDGLNATLKGDVRRAIVSSFLSAYQWVMLLAAGLSFIGALVIALTLKGGVKLAKKPA